MIAIDTNILVYAHRKDAPFHTQANALIHKQIEERALWAIPWPCIYEFLSVVTNKRIFSVPTPLDLSVRQVHTWTRAPNVTLLSESSGYWPIFEALVTRSQVSGGKIHDARIAALCVFHRADVLWTADRDFGRFRQLRTENPLI